MPNSAPSTSPATPSMVTGITRSSPAPDGPSDLVIYGRPLNEQELKSFWLACDRLPVFGVFYRVLLLTAQRREEVAGMRWQELNLDARTWTFPKERTKNGKSHI